MFIDAGYLLTAAALRRTGRTARVGVRCDYAALMHALTELAASQTGRELLRVYWYDGAENALATTEQLEVAALKNVKLRLGRLSGGRQKGVDSLIVRDLMTLARERAIDTAVLISGDEDVREGVAAAQDMGVRVMVLGVDSNSPNQAQSLTNEADIHLVLDDAAWLAHFVATPVAAQPAPPVPVQIIAPGPTQTPDRSPIAPATPSGPNEVGRAYGLGWAEIAPPNDVAQLLRQFPRIPTPMDAAMLAEAERHLGPLHGRDDVRRALRRGFWEGIKASRAGSTSVPPIEPPVEPAPEVG